PKERQSVVVQRGNGTSLYVTRDVAYHLAKFAAFARVVDVLGQDHQLHARTLEALLAEIGEPRRPEFVIYQDITVPEGGRMSTRGGSAVWLDPLLAEAVERAKQEVLARREGLDDAEVDRIAEAVATGASATTSSGWRRRSRSPSDGRMRCRSRGAAGRSASTPMPGRRACSARRRRPARRIRTTRPASSTPTSGRCCG
ncbi:Arginyl-tRNA synthetase, class Ic, core domain protein, partial [mine drainage metagenome]